MSLERPNPLPRIGLALLVGAMAAMWFYAFFLAPSGNPDRLDDRVWATATEARCAATAAVVDALPSSTTATDPAARADLLDRATDELDALVADLGLIEGGNGDDRSLITAWLEDWQVYLDDRRRHTDRLRAEGDIEPLLTALPSGGSHLERQNGFARVNDMRSCLDPGDF